MAKIGAIPSKDIVDGFRGVLDYYCHPNGFVVRSWPRSPGRNRNPQVVAAQGPFTYINKLASTLPPDVIEPYKELALGSGLTWKDYLNRLYINGSIRVTIIPHAEDYTITAEKIMRLQILDAEAQLFSQWPVNASIPWTNLDLSGLVPGAATIAFIRAFLKCNGPNAANDYQLSLRQRSGSQAQPACRWWAQHDKSFTIITPLPVPMDEQKVIQYKYDKPAGGSYVEIKLHLLGYWYEV